MVAFAQAPPLPSRVGRIPSSHPRRRSHVAPITPACARRPVSTKRARGAPRSVDLADDYSPQKLGFLHIATITGAHGVRGELKAQACTDFAQYRLGAGASTRTRHYLLLPNRKYPRPIAVVSGRKASQQDTWILKLQDVKSREEVDSLRGAGLFVKEEDRPKLAWGEYLVGDLVGLRVKVKGQDIGRVKSVMTREEICRAAGSGKKGAAVGNDLLEIELSEQAGKTVLVPFVKQVVPTVDMEDGVIEVDPPKGLFEATVVNRIEKPPKPRGLLAQAKE